MNDQLLQQIDNLLVNRFEVFEGKFDRKLDEQAERFDRKLDEQIGRLDRKIDEQAKHFDSKLDQKADELRRHTGVLLDRMHHKIDLVIEGQQGLAERMDRFEVRLESVEQQVIQQSGQIQGLAAELAAHRHDTEAHGHYMVRE